jgi:anti-sigma regulatory factor (Ser/Thr protein kinase)
MTPMAPPRLNRSVPPPLGANRRRCRVPLRADVTAAAAARVAVADAVRAWGVPVDPDAAVLLTSELVTNAVTHAAPAAGPFVLLIIAREAAGLRVDVHDGSADLPVLEGAAPAEAETGRGLVLVTSLAAEWGFYRTRAGKAVYFILAAGPATAGAATAGDMRAGDMRAVDMRAGDMRAGDNEAGDSRPGDDRAGDIQADGGAVFPGYDVLPDGRTGRPG